MTLTPFAQRLAGARTKIVATVGPACRHEDVLTELALAGADVFRLNMAHADFEVHDANLQTIRSVSQKIGRPLAVLVDLAGPKMRLGELPGGQLVCEEGAIYRFVRGEESANAEELVCTYPRLVDELDVDDRVMLADGTVGLVVIEKTAEFARCRVVQAGLIRSRQGVNLPGVKLSVEALSATDREAAAWAARAGVDYVSLSFVRTADEIRQLKLLLRMQHSAAKVVAKIEKPEALDNLDDIVRATDAVMVARGDLGVEIDVALMPVAQKRIIATCNRFQKPVIVATQMLDSMQRSLQPTRAEVTDVANAILDGCDACMLSGETAIGEHPRAAVEMIGRIARATEPLLRTRPAHAAPEAAVEGLHQITQAVIFGGGHIARQLNAQLLLAYTHSGPTALALSKQRNLTPIIAVSDSETTLRQMCLFWGVSPLPNAPANDNAALLTCIDHWGRRDGYLKPGDRLIFVRGTNEIPPVHNMLVVYQLEE